jgi:hypothetical protein
MALYHRRVAGVQPGDVEAGLVRGDQLAVIRSRSRSAVSTSRAPGGAVSSSSRGTERPA